MVFGEKVEGFRKKGRGFPEKGSRVFGKRVEGFRKKGRGFSEKGSRVFGERVEGFRRKGQGTIRGKGRWFSGKRSRVFGKRVEGFRRKGRGFSEKDNFCPSLSKGLPRQSSDNRFQNLLFCFLKGQVLPLVSCPSVVQKSKVLTAACSRFLQWTLQAVKIQVSFIPNRSLNHWNPRQSNHTGPDSNDRLGINENTTVLGKYIGNPQPNRKVRTWKEPTSEGIAHGKMETLAIFERRNVVKAFLPRFVG